MSFAWHGPFTLRITLNFVYPVPFARFCLSSRLFADINENVSNLPENQLKQELTSIKFCYVCVYVVHAVRVNLFAVNIINGSDEWRNDTFSIHISIQNVSSIILFFVNQIIYTQAHSTQHTQTHPGTNHYFTWFRFRWIFVLTRWSLSFILFTNDFRLTIIYFEISTN